MAAFLTELLSPPEFVNAMAVHGEGGVWHLLSIPELLKYEQAALMIVFFLVSVKNMCMFVA